MTTIPSTLKYYYNFSLLQIALFFKKNISMKGRRKYNNDRVTAKHSAYEINLNSGV